MSMYYKRLKYITENGEEIFDSSITWARHCVSISKTELSKEPSNIDTSKTEVQEAENCADERFCIDLLQQAKEEIDVILKTITWVEEGLLGLREAKKPKTVASLAEEHTLKVATQSCKLKQTAAALRAGASQLRDRIAADDGFFRDIGRLQRAWPITLASGPERAAEYAVEIKPPPSARTGCPPRLFDIVKSVRSRAVVCARAAADGGAIGRGVGAGGSEAAAGAGGRAESSEGAEGIHSFLRCQEEDLWWEAAESVLKNELNTGNGPVRDAVFLHGLSQQLPLLRECREAAGAAYAAAFRILCGAAQAGPHPAPTAAADPAAAKQPGYIGRLAGHLRHARFRAYVRHMLDLQAARLPETGVFWARCWTSTTSAARIRLDASRTALLVIRENNLELEGIFDWDGELRWLKDCSTRILHPEIPFFMSELQASVAPRPPPV